MNKGHAAHQDRSRTQRVRSVPVNGVVMGRILPVLAALSLSACTVVPEYHQPRLDLPPSHTATTTPSRAQREAMVDWWTRFHDPVLNRLIRSALDDNLGIALQAARIRAARAQLGLAHARFYPTLGGRIKAGSRKASLAATPQARGRRTTEHYAITAMLGYELNLLAALARQEAAAGRLLSSVYARDAMRLAVIGDIVATYMSLRAVQRKIRITRAGIDVRRHALALAEQYYKHGTSSKLAVLQQRALLASARTELPRLRQRAGQLESALAILVGKTAREIMTEAGINPVGFADIHLPGDLPSLLPSALINRRPDIRAAEAALIAANARLGVAKAQYFPTLNLMALIGSAATAIGDLFQAVSATHSITGALTGPLLTFGRIEARVDTAKARRRVAEIRYRATVRRAFAEVRDALSGVETTHERVQTARQQVAAYERSLALAQTRYEFGRVGLQAVLEARRHLYRARLTLTDAVRGRFVAAANLLKALGGGWAAYSAPVTAVMDTVQPNTLSADNK